MARLTAVKFGDGFGGLSVTSNLVAADASGDEVIWKRKQTIFFENLDATPTTVTIVTPREVEGLGVEDKAIVVGNGELVAMPNLDGAYFADSSGIVSWDYSKTTNLKVTVFEE